MEETIQFKLNGKSVSLSADGDRKLLWILRTDLGLTSAKYGCGEGRCGSPERMKEAIKKQTRG
jgi:aerobic-type carbon monoxide dehydrogenase small subunit (CoxS/CutS family)